MSREPIEASSADDPREDLLRRLRRDGALYFPALVAPAEIHAVRDEFTEVLAAHDWLADGHPAGDLVPRVRARHGAPGWWRLYQAMQSRERFHALAHAPALVAAVQRILGTQVLNHPRRQVTMLSTGFWVPPHQEHLSVQGTPDVLTAWLPLDAGDGPEILVEPAPRRVRALVRDRHGVGVPLPADELRWLAAVDGFRPGDVLLVHAMAIRRTPQHAGAALRLSLEYRYQPAFEAVARGSLLPHHFPRVPGWRDLTRGWHSRRWVRAPLVKQVVDFAISAQIETWHQVLPRRSSSLVDMAEL